MASDILAVGLNAALQKTLVFDRVVPGEVNRAISTHREVGGKGAHFAKAANRLRPGCCTVAQFLGGDSGRYVAERLTTDGIPQLNVEIRHATRICTTLLDRTAGQMTELVEPSPQIEPDEEAAMMKRLDPLLPKVKAVGLCGTFPPGVSAEFYARLARHKGDAVLLLDGYRDVAPTLATGQVDILKINLEELRRLAGTEELDRAVRKLMTTYNVTCVAVTDGARRAHLFAEGTHYQYRLPTLGRVVNPLAAGDTAAGVMLTKLTEGLAYPAAFAWALAAATASCLQLEGACFLLEDLHRMHDQLTVDPPLK